MRVIFADKTPPFMKSCHEHSHMCYELIITIEGKDRINCGDIEFETKKGNIIIIPPNTRHSSISEEGYTEIYIHTDEFDFQIDRPVCFWDNTDMLVTVANMLYMNYVQKEFNYENINHKIMEMIFEYITRLRKRLCRHEFVWDFKKIMTENLSNSLFDISQESKNLGVSFDYMRHCFKEEIGMTPLEYLTEIRIKHAKNLLKHNRIYRILEVADMCGYKDQYYFSKMFKKTVGVSPRKYRETINHTEK